MDLIGPSDEGLPLGYAWLRMNAMKFWQPPAPTGSGTLAFRAPPCMACDRMRSSGKSSVVRPAKLRPNPAAQIGADDMAMQPSAVNCWRPASAAPVSATTAAGVAADSCRFRSFSDRHRRLE